jgi:hypothetical protein
LKRGAAREMGLRKRCNFEKLQKKESRKKTNRNECRDGQKQAKIEKMGKRNFVREVL